MWGPSSLTLEEAARATEQECTGYPLRPGDGQPVPRRGDAGPYFTFACPICGEHLPVWFAHLPFITYCPACRLYWEYPLPPYDHMDPKHAVEDCRAYALFGVRCTGCVPEGSEQPS